MSHLNLSEMEHLKHEEQRGQRAREVLENEVFKDAFKGVRESIIASWEAAPIRDKDGQHELKLMLKLLTDVQRNIEDIAQTGMLAKLQIEREQETLLGKAAKFLRG
jgi:hypothetical protein